MDDQLRKTILVVGFVLLSGCSHISKNAYETSSVEQRSNFKKVILPLPIGTHFKISQGAFGHDTHNEPGFICTPQLHFNIFQDREHTPENGVPKRIPVLFEGLPNGGIAREGFEGFVPPPIEITLINPNPRSEAERELLYQLLTEYDLRPYIFTHKVQIEPMVIPHSDPILTLNTRHSENPDMVLTTFLHEEIHWFLDDRKEQTDDAIQELKSIFPSVPSGGSEGAETIHSTYLHLIVCWLELQADKYYLGSPNRCQTSIEKTASNAVFLRGRS